MKDAFNAVQLIVQKGPNPLRSIQRDESLAVGLLFAVTYYRNKLLLGRKP